MGTRVEKDKVRKILAKLKSTVNELLRDKFVDIILFGSYARGIFLSIQM